MGPEDGRVRGEVVKGGGGFPGAGVQEDLVAGVHERAGVGEAEPVGRTGDEDAGHGGGPFLRFRVAAGGRGGRTAPPNSVGSGRDREAYGWLRAVRV